MALQPSLVRTGCNCQNFYVLRPCMHACMHTTLGDRQRPDRAGARCCCTALRPAHKKECKQQSQRQLRVSISSKPPGGGPGAPSSWVGLSQGDVNIWAARQVNGFGHGNAPPQAMKMIGNIDVKHEKLFDIKIQVTSQTACSLAYAMACCVSECAKHHSVELHRFAAFST